MTQLVVRVDEDLIAIVDRLVADGDFASRSDAVRTALQRLVDEARRRRIGQAIIDGYRRMPQDDALWSDAGTIHMISEEPW